MDVRLRQKNTELYTNRRNKNDRNKNRSNQKSNHHEEKARNSGKKLVVECRKDLEKVKTKKEEGKWEATRGDLLKRIGIDKGEIKCGRERGNQEIVNSSIDKDLKERRRRKTDENQGIKIYEDIITTYMKI